MQKQNSENRIYQKGNAKIEKRKQNLPKEKCNNKKQKQKLPKEKYNNRIAKIEFTKRKMQ